MQAAKARRYKEYADRLQELRTQVGLADWRQLSEQLTSAGSRTLPRLESEIVAAGTSAERAKQQSATGRASSHESTTLVRTSEVRIAQNRERIAALETAIDAERTRIARV